MRSTWVRVDFADSSSATQNNQQQIEQQDALAKKLAKVSSRYLSEFHNNPDELLSRIPENEMWRLFIDGCHQAQDIDLSECMNLDLLNHSGNKDYLHYSLDEIADTEVMHDKALWNKYLSRFAISGETKKHITVADFIRFNKGLFIYEIREPQYMASLYGAIKSIFEQKHSLDLDFICSLHASSLSKTGNTNFEDKNDGREIGKIRTIKMMHFGLNDKTASEKGLVELFESGSPFSSIWLGGLILLSMSNNGFQYSGFSAAVSGGFFDYQKSYPLGAQALEAIKSKEDLAKLVMSQIAQGYGVKLCSVVDSAVSEQLKDEANNIIQQYNDAINGAYTPIAKLAAIINVVQGLEQLHIFNDGNCRTLCMLLLNHLLVNNGFPLCIMDDPNCFDACSVTELTEKVIEGMDRTFQLIDKGCLYDVQTESLLALADSQNSLGLTRAYFEQIFEIEKQRRNDATVIKSLFLDSEVRVSTSASHDARFFADKAKRPGGGNAQDKELPSHSNKRARDEDEEKPSSETSDPRQSKRPRLKSD